MNISPLPMDFRENAHIFPVENDHNHLDGHDPWDPWDQLLSAPWLGFGSGSRWSGLQPSHTIPIYGYMVLKFSEIWGTLTQIATEWETAGGSTGVTGLFSLNSQTCSRPKNRSFFRFDRIEANGSPGKATCSGSWVSTGPAWGSHRWPRQVTRRKKPLRNSSYWSYWR